MLLSSYRLVPIIALLFALVQAARAAEAEPPAWRDDIFAGKLEFQYSPYTYHFSGSEGHSNVQLAGLTLVRDSGWMWGGALFSNSFGQPSAVVFGGRRYEEPFGWRRFYWHWAVGMMYGYKPPYEDKVPVNWNGYSPVVFPALGYRFTPAISGQVTVLGSAGFMFQLAIELDQLRSTKGP
jgi:hypothetical protein